MILVWLFIGLVFYIIPLAIFHAILYYFWIKSDTNGTTFGDMYDYYYELWDFPVVLFSWIPGVNCIILIILVMWLMVARLSNIKIR